ncbi:lipocalin family protein [Mucilaginibacter sp. BT774]|uniref:lipocalin family protein n=1 Tax=Mucilaginibacter sp. BT774 TaxID=3062276 RepID=UPI002676E9A7|nr:lipocalin family protein [Mucilaginibacter sp. BT774]MDO3624721.1 lipocalin family protein [Mucilaginibacter sp. BT774]
MNKVFGILLLIVLLGSLAGCKKDAKSHISSALIGKWYLRQYNVRVSSTDTGYHYYIESRFGDTSTYYFCQFNRDGTGVQRIYTEGSAYNISPTNFTYSVADNNITFSSNWALHAKACSYEILSNDTLVIRSNFNYTYPGMAINSLQELKLTK